MLEKDAKIFVAGHHGLVGSEMYDDKFPLPYWDS